jgi:hypothetical protein
MASEKNYWSDVKRKLLGLSTEELIKLIYDLHSLSQSNKDFLEARFLKDKATLERYRELIKQAIAPYEPWKHDYDLRQARKYLSDYKKAAKDELGLLDLMISYVEYGIEFIDEYGISENEPYENSLFSLFESALKIVGKHEIAVDHPLMIRLKPIKKFISDLYDLEE